MGFSVPSCLLQAFMSPPEMSFWNAMWSLPGFPTALKTERDAAFQAHPNVSFLPCPLHSPGSLYSSQVEMSCKMPVPLMPTALCQVLPLLFWLWCGLQLPGTFLKYRFWFNRSTVWPEALSPKVPGWHPMLLLCDHTFFSQSLEPWFSNLSEHQNDLELWKHKFPALPQAFWVSRLWWRPWITFVAKSANCLWVEKRGASVSSFLACLLLQFLESHINAWTMAALTEHAKSWDYPPLCSTRQ